MSVPNHNFRVFPFSRSAAGATHDGDADAPMVAGGHTTGPCHKRGRPEDPRSRPNLREVEGSAVAVIRACGQGRRGVRREAGTRAQPRRDGQRPRGRPKKRWMDYLREDMRATGVCPAVAADRTKWKAKCRKADPAPRRDLLQEEEEEGRLV